ncbi:hypothetical protein SmJEL517_g00513 [Synchytrium microbalum]|uniref:Uncharacterized protein n=1 Tax=Synchytrium microbalum TaxID=1806994 RepID=A0A507CED8_9FUNG|nr:uncharacterized protein SmJEL517_g00513 [Synchytrium microbalum]TPX37718.1 hypothetical protein SmJEL517_g00513 [Synchytrium microbalum]
MNEFAETSPASPAFEESDYTTWNMDPLRTRIVYHFMMTIGELVGKLWADRDLIISPSHLAVSAWTFTAKYRDLRTEIVHNPHHTFLNSALPAARYKTMHDATTAAFNDLDKFTTSL